MDDRRPADARVSRFTNTPFLLMTHLEFFLVAVLASYLCANALRRWALGRKQLALSKLRSPVTLPPPHNGGVALVGITLLLWFGWLATVPFKLPIPLSYVGIAISGTLLVAIISWLDDDRGGVPVAIRATVYVIAAVLAISIYGWWRGVELPLLGRLNWGWAGIPLTLLWVVILLHVYSFMDGIDGLAAVLGFVAAIGWAWLGWLLHENAISLWGAVVAGACLGFLFLNWPPAKIRLGLVGGTFLGFTFGVFPLLVQTALSGKDAIAAAARIQRLPVAALLFVAPPLLDAAYTFFARAFTRRDVLASHRSHLYQRLAISGLPHRNILAIYGLLSIVSGLAGVAYVMGQSRAAWGVAVCLAVLSGFAVLWSHVKWRERKGMANQFGKLPDQAILEIRPTGAIPTSGAIIVIGAGSFGREVCNWAEDAIKAGAAPWRLKGFLDDNPNALEGFSYGAKIIGGIAGYQPRAGDRFVCAIGNPAVKKNVCDAIVARGGVFTNLIHPTAVIGHNVKLGTGVVLGPYTVLTCDLTVGDHTAFATSNTAGHDAWIGNWSHLGGHCEIGGGAVVEDGVFLGGRVAVAPRARVPAWTRVPPGASVSESGINPAAAGPASAAAAPLERQPPPPERHVHRPPAASATRLFLSPPHMGESELRLIQEVFASNYIAPTGPMVEAFEQEFAERTGFKHALAVSSGTAAMHLALRGLGIKPGDKVFAATLTFIGSVSPILYQGATPVFFDADPATWNLDPELLEHELHQAAARGQLPKAVIPTDLYGQSCDLGRILEICAPYGVPVICDAAESEGADYRGRHAGKGAKAAVFSFNGNKIITTSGGGMLASDDPAFIAHARKLATQAREPVPWYEHREIGYNYRMSNVLAAIGRGQLQVLEERVRRRRKIFAGYQARLGGLPGIEFMPEAPYGRGNRWLTVILVTPEVSGATSEQIRLALEAENIEARPVWKPMHLQPVFRGCRAVGGGVSEDLFARGLCLPSGTAMTDADLDRVCAVVRGCLKG